MAAATIWWVRSDLRLDDNPALAHAAARGGGVVPVFVWSPAEEGEWPAGAATRWWLDRSLRALDASLRERGSRLVVRRGPSLEVLRDLARETGADAVGWNRRYEPASIARDRDVKAALREGGLAAHSFNAALLAEPWENTKDDGTPYRVFTPFWKSMIRRGGIEAPVAAPSRLSAPPAWPASDDISDLGLLPKVDWTAGMREAWTPGEAGAARLLERFVAGAVERYPEERDLPDRDGTSRLSPHLHFGEVSPRRAWAAARARAAGHGSDASVEAWLRQLAWREFAHHLLFHFPHTALEPLRAEFSRLPWRDDEARLGAWQRGLTGYPFVDAGMRELWTTGWMHNRVRMVAASFLTKDLLVPWQSGARWFWDTLVDADLANNTLGWQWTAGCGADAAPYFRVFNPVGQGRRFDPRGVYLRRWLPELAGLDDKWIHEPFAAPPGVLEKAGVVLGATYPAPIVAHDEARRTALEAYDTMVRER